MTLFVSKLGLLRRGTIWFRLARAGVGPRWKPNGMRALSIGLGGGGRLASFVVYINEGAVLKHILSRGNATPAKVHRVQNINGVQRTCGLPEG